MSEDKDIWDALLGSEKPEAPRKQYVIFEDSSILKDARYDSLMQTLTVSFKNSHGVYSYFDIPSEVVRTLLSSGKDGSSAGKYFIKHIKNIYPFKRIT